MPLSQPFDILLAHDRWATRQILEACVPLTVEQFHKPFEMGPGSLHNTIEHVLGATRFWTDLLAARGPRPRLEVPGSRRSIDEFSALLDEIATDFATVARARPLDELVSTTRGGQTYAFPRGGVITHVATHAMHHRAQCLNMLRQLNVKPLPMSGVSEWMRSGSPEK